MRTQLQITKDTAERQLRAYMSVSNLSVRDASQAKQSPIAKAVMINSGQTPAYNCKALSSIKVIARSDIKEYEIPLPLNKEAGIVVGPNCEFNVHKRLVTSLDDLTVAKLSKGEVVIIFSGAVTYEDAFGNTRTFYFNGWGTKFDSPDGGIISPLSWGNKAT